MQSRGVGNDIIYVAVVDDDESLCRSFSRLLRTAGFQAISYPSAEAFLQDTKRPRFDCLVLDIQLGGMSGIELSRRLAAVKDPTPIIFITAHDDPDVQAQAVAGGCGGFFHKSDSAQLVLEAIRQAAGSPACNPLEKSSLATSIPSFLPVPPIDGPLVPAGNSAARHSKVVPGTHLENHEPKENNNES